MAQPILSQFLTFYTDKDNRQAVKIAEQAEQIKQLKAYLADATETSCQNADRVTIATARNSYLSHLVDELEERAARAEELLEQVYNLTPILEYTEDQERYYYPIGCVQHIKEAIDTLLYAPKLPTQQEVTA